VVSPRPCGRRALAIALVVAALAPAPAAAQLYRWTDADGVVRYTNALDAIPPAFRPGAVDLGSPQAREPEAAPATDPTVIPFAAGGPIRAPVHVNGVALTLMVDTGADRTVVSPAALARAGIASDAGRTVQIVGVTGQVPAREVMVERLDVAGSQVGPVAVVAHDVGVGEVDGLLGRDVLDRFTVTIDAATGRAVLTPRRSR
jgi:hypothetical protein